MSREEKVKYTCPRCGYNVNHKGAMKKHLYGLKKDTCQALLPTSIELTPEIKEHIVKNRIYYPPPTPTPTAQPGPTTINNTINNIQTMNNYVSNMDMLVKLNQVMQHDNLELISFDEKVETKYETLANKLTSHNARANISFTRDNIFDMIQNMIFAHPKALNEFNLFYDKDKDRIYYYMGKIWEDQYHAEGAKYLIDTLVSNYLDFYEVYIIRQVTNGAFCDRSTLMNHLEDYYRFTSTFEIKPYVRGKRDSNILYNEDDGEYDTGDEYTISDRFNSLYLKCMKDVTSANKKALYKTVIDIIKISTKANLKELNKRVMDIIKVDETFKMAILAM